MSSMMTEPLNRMSRQLHGAVTDENSNQSRICAGPVGAVEAGSPVSLSAEGSTDANGDKLT